ncbi:hypothetical protein DMENIID0001_025250 [Sergentomyia squamirostris]
MVLVSAYMVKFLDQQPITRSAVANREAIPKDLKAIDALDVSSRDPWLIHWTLNNLNQQKRMLWNEKKPEGTPMWKDFDKFLDNRRRILESCPAAQLSSKSKPVSSHATGNRSQKHGQKRENLSTVI